MSTTEPLKSILHDAWASSSVIIYVLGTGLILWELQKRLTRISIAKVPGPEPESFLLGNLPEIFQSQAGAPDFKWQKQFGGVVRVKGAFGEDRLLISDPKAMQYIFHTGGYRFEKWPERTEISRLLMGRGLLWADGDIHKRQRKIMMPGFGTHECRAFLPIFQNVATQLSEKWTEILSTSPDQSADINVATWLSRATMDSLGISAFDYYFDALKDDENEFMKAYTGLMADTLMRPSRKSILMNTMLPVWVLKFMSKYSNARNIKHARHTEKLANAITRNLIDSKAEMLLQGKGNTDVLSLLVKANTSADGKTKLTDEEMLAQMRTLLLAGHETSATTLCWVLLELARHKDVQDKLRAEIRELKQSKGGHAQFTQSDFQNMPYTLAVMKESMRVHPALYHNYRRPTRDEVIPLSRPLTLTDGQVLNELPIAKGTKIFASIAGYQRDKEVYGEDADVYRPERWLKELEDKKGPSVGVWGNLLVFSGGIRSCIGYKFALLEVQALLVEIINNFELSTTPELAKLRREACLVTVPTLAGQEDKGETLPLHVSLAPQE